MYSRSLRQIVENFEFAMGHSHRCLQCRSTFLAHEDGCPHCGAGAPTMLLNEFQGTHSENQDDNIWYIMIHNDYNGKVEYVFLGDSSPWPRQRSIKKGENKNE